MRLPQDRILHIGTELKDGKVNVTAEWQGELVRCKDCRWWNSETNGCKRNPSVEAWYETDFCKYGERKEPLPQYEEWQEQFEKMCESATPKTFVADERYTDTFKGEEE